MIKALSIMKLLQVIKRHIRQSGLNFQKCYERDQKMRGRGRKWYNGSGVRRPDKSNSRLKLYYKP